MLRSITYAPALQMVNVRLISPVVLVPVVFYDI